MLAFAATGEQPLGDGPPSAMPYRVVHGTPALDRVPVTVWRLGGKNLGRSYGAMVSGFRLTRHDVIRAAR